MPRRAICHPDRRHFGRGLCASCYSADYRQRHGKAITHRNSQMGLTHLGEPERELPFRPRPSACPKCGNRVLRSHPQRPEVSCPCGWETFCVPEAGIEALAAYVLPHRRDVTDVLLTGGV